MFNYNKDKPITKKKITISIDKDLDKALSIYCEKNRKKKSTVINEVLKQHIRYN